MSDAFDQVITGLLFIAFSAFALWWLRREYKGHAKLTWFGSIVHVLMYAIHSMFCGTLALGADGRQSPGSLTWLGIPLMVIGFGIILFGMDLFRKFSRWIGSDTPGLKTDGVYRYSRNPQFVGYGLLFLGFFLAWWNSLAWIALLSYAALAYTVTLIEEEHLTRVYGDSYREYCQRIPRYLGLPKRS